MRLTSESKLLLGIVAATLTILVAGIFFFSKPVPTLSRSELLPQDTVTKGNKDAQVYLIEFSDFQCPACKSFKPVVDSLVEKYKDKMVFGYRHFPLDQHNFAVKAALASEAANNQGKFWEMYSLLFDSQENLSEGIFPELADKLKLDKEKFTKDTNDSLLKEKIERDRSFGVKIGVDATPTFFLNGKKLTLYSQNDLEKAVAAAVSLSTN